MLSLRIIFLILIFFFNRLASQQADSIITENRVAFHPQGLYIPLALMAGGISAHLGNRTSIENQIAFERNEHLFGFTNHIDDYAQFSPFLASYAFEWAGMIPRTDWKNRTAIMIKGQVVNLGLVYLMKIAFKSVRPDGTAYSFPSGHTANAFAGATLLSMEYGNQYRWVPYASYTVAGGIGIMRVVNNKHYVSDVLFGAGLGILSMKLAYWIHQYRWNRPKSDHDPLTALYIL